MLLIGVAFVALLASVVDNVDNGDDVPSASLYVLVLVFVASVPSRTISRSRGEGKAEERCVMCISVVVVTVQQYTKHQYV